MNRMAIKIAAADTVPLQNPSSQTASKISAAEAQKTFDSTFKNGLKQNTNEALTAILTQVKTCSEKLIKKPDAYSLKAYKDSIKQFLKKVSDTFLSLKEEFSINYGTEQKLYQLVDLASGKAEALTEETLKDDEAMTMLAKLDEIRGLVLDIIA